MDTIEALKKTRLGQAEGIAVDEVNCCSHRSSWGETERSTTFSVVFVRRGCFLRRVGRDERLADPGIAYFERPGDEQQVSHPRDGGDVCTVLTLPEDVVASLCGEPILPEGLVFTTPADDLVHRHLLVALARRSDASELAEQVLHLVSGMLRTVGMPLIAEGSKTEMRHRFLVDEVRPMLLAEPGLTLTDLARRAAVSPYHLSRVFRLQTGQTFSQYRNRLRVRLALDRFTQGERNFARLAADLGFSDHAHLTRTVRSETGWTPSGLRMRLADSGMR
jgi:AraC-like DNA-binding protein